MNIPDPKQEAEFVNDSNEVYQYKYILQRINHYSGCSCGDVLVDKKNNKFAVTYIDPEFKFVYGRKICKTGKLSKQLSHITGMFHLMQIDPMQANAAILDENYDPTKAIKDKAARKRAAAYRRRKQRVKGLKDMTEKEIETWCKNNLHVGQEIWWIDTYRDRFAADYKYTITSIGQYRMTIVDDTGWEVTITYYGGFNYNNLYLDKPVTYEDIV